MPPKTKKRKGAKESEEELLINERLTEIFFKYSQNDDSSDEDESVGMFGEEDQQIKIKDVENVVKEVGVVEWDPSVLVLIDQEERENGRISMEKIKTILMTLTVRREAFIT